VNNNPRVLFVCSGTGRFGISPFVKRQADSLKKANIDIELFSINDRGLKGYIKNIPKLREYIRNKEKPFDIIHAHYTLSGWVGFFAKKHSQKLVVSYMGSDVYGPIKEGGKKGLSFYIFVAQSLLLQIFCHVIIVKSHYLFKYILKKKKCKVIPNGVNFNLFKPLDKTECRKELNLDGTGKIVLFMGDTNDPRKNYDLAKSAFERLNKNGVTLLAPYPVSPEKVSTYYNACDVLVFPSFYEGSPYVVAGIGTLHFCAIFNKFDLS